MTDDPLAQDSSNMLARLSAKCLHHGPTPVKAIGHCHMLAMCLIPTL